MQQPKIVLVEWEDACNLDAGVTWAEPEIPEKYNPVIHHSVGFLLLDEPGGVVITGSFSEAAFGPRDQIPRGMIRSITVLKEALVPPKKASTRRKS